MSLSSLKADLKSFEASFRSSHDGKDPTKEDIKRLPEIAEMYKRYNKLKMAANGNGSGKEKEKEKERERVRLPPPPSASSASSSTETSTNTFKTPTKARPSSRHSTTTNSTTQAKDPSPSKTTYVIANSPSKLRQLASMHSSRRSPNHPSRGVNGEGLVVVGSPKKYNPFGREEGTKKNDFTERLRRSAEKEKRKIGDGGDGGDIFGGSGIVKKREKERDDMEMDTSLGPSPVKFSNKAFKPLFTDADRDGKPKLFESTFDSKVAKKLQEKEMGEKEKKRSVARRSPEIEVVIEDEASKKNGKTNGRKTKKQKLEERRIERRDEDDDIEMDESGLETMERRRRTRDKGTFVVDLSDDDGNGKGKQVVIRPPGRHLPVRRTLVDDMELDGGEDADADDVTTNDNPPGSLFYRDHVDLLARDTRRTTAKESSEEAEDATPDPSILSLLSLDSTSPLKKAVLLREKDREKKIKKLLEDPGTEKRVTGLLDMSPSEEEEGAVDEEDDDWASENEGWKDLGDGMMDGDDW